MDFACEAFPLTVDNTEDRLLSTVKGRSGVGKPVDVVQGTVDLLIMKAVALKPVHGWAI